MIKGLFATHDIPPIVDVQARLSEMRLLTNIIDNLDTTVVPASLLAFDDELVLNKYAPTTNDIVPP
jgi:hypothetical protein